MKFKSFHEDPGNALVVCGTWTVETRKLNGIHHGATASGVSSCLQRISASSKRDGRGHSRSEELQQRRDDRNNYYERRPACSDHMRRYGG